MMIKKILYTTPILKDFFKFFDDPRAGLDETFATDQDQDRPHARIKRNNADPDEGNSRSCSACKLPIFSTPYITTNTDVDVDKAESKVFLHEQCANLPERLEDCDLHPEKPLFLGENESSTGARCSECGQRCGNKLYRCPDEDCGLQLDVACALTIKISHRSHRHRLMAVRGGHRLTSLICGACGTKHGGTSTSSAGATVSYLCNACDFWIHPRCASLPNAIGHYKHEHPLVLNYDRRAASGPQSSMVSSILDIIRSVLQPHHDPWRCETCGDTIQSVGAYSCIKCPCHVHIMCAVSKTRKFTPVPIRDARLPDLVRLPIPDENTSMIRYIKGSTDATSRSGDHPHRDKVLSVLQAIDNIVSGSSSDEESESSPSLAGILRRSIHQLTEGPSTRDPHDDVELLRRVLGLHPHTLTFRGHDHNNYDDDDDAPRHLCDACVKPISRPPFYSCSMCPDFFLHDSCCRLPLLLFSHPAHDCETSGDNHFFRLQRPDESLFSPVICSHCKGQYTGFSYSCFDCRDFNLDVSCALMPESITHDAHGRTHILSLSSKGRQDGYCDCCGNSLDNLGYRCRTCDNFGLHTWCAMLPDTVRHEFDRHPLKLTTTATSERSQELIELMICEICESGINKQRWYYSCNECEQSFHADCIPSLDALSKIKFGLTVRVGCHGCPLTLIRGLTLRGHRCGCCGKTFDDDDRLAFECSKCCFWIDLDCAKKLHAGKLN